MKKNNDENKNGGHFHITPEYRVENSFLRVLKLILGTAKLSMVASFSDYKDHNLFIHASKKLIME
jgi:hypothetical protein